MVDNFSILLSHALLGLALWRLMRMDAVDHEPPAPDWDQPDAGDRRLDGWGAGDRAGHRAGGGVGGGSGGGSGGGWRVRAGDGQRHA